MKYCLNIFALAAALLAAESAKAVTITQGVGDNFIAFEAEIGDLTTDGTTQWVVTPDLEGSNGSVLNSEGPNQNSNAATSAGASYNLNFNSDGTYYLYFRNKHRGFGADTFYTPNDIDLALTDSDYRANEGGLFGTPTPNAYFWSQPNPDYPSVLTTYAVTPGQLNTDLNLSLKVRETAGQGLSLDYVVLSKDGNLTPTQLDAFINIIPEPSTVLLVSCCLASMIFSRQRRKA